MIEKKIKYDINIEKPSKTKPVKQGGVFNYLGKQKTVSAPVKWRSSKDHPIAHLSYITKDEQKILIDLNLYGSLKGKPNRGPFGLPSLQGSGSGSGGDGGSSGGDGGQGDSGPGGSDDGSGHGGPGGQGDSGPGGSDDGSGHGGPGGPGDSGPGGSDDGTGHGGVGSVGPSTEGFGIGPNAEEEAAQSAAANTGLSGVANALAGFAKEAFENAVNNPVATALGMVNPALGFAYGQATKAAEAANRGVTPPDDYSQAQTSVQSNTPSPTNSGGIGTIQAYAPLYNPDTGNPTMDAYIRRLRLNLGLPV